MLSASLNARNNTTSPIYEDETLAAMLGQLQLNETIPEELYKVVAEVFRVLFIKSKKRWRSAREVTARFFFFR
ncbi:MAG: hypothetical protein KatS3mg080_0161 [Anoxybacillus sp.]|nr:MAG: hypothetical protein KatS3mg080_0161 [Anoxybacillus sp.]